MKDTINRAQALYAKVGGWEHIADPDFKEAVKLLYEFTQEYDLTRLDHATTEFFHKHDDFKMQAEIDKVLEHHTNREYHMYSTSNSQQLVTIINTDEDDDVGAIDFHAAPGTPRRLLGHDFFMAVIEGRLDKDSQGFFNSWFGALFNEDGTLSFDEARYEGEHDDEAFYFWTDMRDTCSKFPYDKNCRIG